MPPATNTGTSSTNGRISCARTEVETGPIWPPASMPSITSASAPLRTSFLASASEGAKQTTLAPPALSRCIVSRGGRPPASTTWPTRWSRQTSASSSSCGCMTIRLTPNGRSVSAAVAAISAASSSGPIEPQASTPKPPALLIAATRCRSDTQVMAPPRTASSLPRKRRPRCQSASTRVGGCATPCQSLSRP